MFVGDEMLLDLGFSAARAQLAGVIDNGSLARASVHAYSDATAPLALADSAGSALAASWLTETRFRVWAAGDCLVWLMIRWEAAGPWHGPFPAFDAEISLSPAGSSATLLQLAGEYQAVAGEAGRGLSEATRIRAAVDTAQDFLRRVASALARAAADDAAADDTGAAAEPPYGQAADVGRSRLTRSA
jgi:hypothetical protein